MSTIEIPRIVSREQLDFALVRRKTMSHLRLGDALVQENVITSQQRDAALAMQAGDPRKPLGEILVAIGAVTREEVRRVLVEQLGVPSVNLARFQYDPHAIKAVHGDLARKHTVMPLYRTGTRIAVGIENPLSWEALQELEQSTGLKVDPAMAGREELLAAIAQVYGGAGVDDPLKSLGAVPGVEDVPAERFSKPSAIESQDTLAVLAGNMIMEACAQGTLVIHLESVPGEFPRRVRFRVEGIAGPG
jgi:hypothetical protein